MTDDQLNAFMSDPDLFRLIDLVKISDDILDVIRLSETQHSEMLAWCLNPGEGHSQGDAVIKDFLIAAYSAAVSGGCVHDTKKFFATWTPARIQRTSFGSAFITREFHIDQPGIGKKGRLDLLLVDTQNKILVAIENKAGASLTKEQLQFYVDAVNQRIGGKRAFKDFQFAYVVLDRDLDDYEGDQLADLGKRWALLNYSWLKTAAMRAKQHVDRHNQAAHLLMAYCQNLTDWEKPEQSRTSILATELAQRHEAVVDAMKSLRRSSILAWAPSTLIDGDLCLFVHQNRHLCEELVRASGIPGMVTMLQNELGDAAEIQKDGPTRLSFATRSMQLLQKPGQDWWPMYIHVRKRDQEDERSSYTVRFVMNHSGFASEPGPLVVREALKGTVSGVTTFPEANHRRITIKKDLNFESAVALAKESAQEIDKRLQQLLSSRS